MAARAPIPSLAGLLRDRRGTAIVETAIMLPLVTLLLFGLVEAGRALQHQHALNKSVRDAARYLARIPLACPATADTGWASAKVNAQNLALTGRLTGGTPIIANWTAGTFTIADPVCETWAGRSVQVISVTADAAYQDIGFLHVIGVSPFRIGAAHQQVHIGE